MAEVTKQRRKRIATLIEPLRVEPGAKVHLGKDFDPGYTVGPRPQEGRRASCCRRASRCSPSTRPGWPPQETYGVLVCLQSLDAGGKDGTIRHVMSGVNPQGVQRQRLQGPLRRGTGPRLPVALRPPAARPRRDRHLQPVALRGGPRGAGPPRGPGPPAAAAGRRRAKDIWDRRYREINDWERYLADNGFTVVKLFLNLSKEEQRTRFLKRIDLPERNWKFSAADARERGGGTTTRTPSPEMLSATSTEHAPVVRRSRPTTSGSPASAPAAVLAHTLIEIDPQYPTVDARRRAASSARPAGTRGARRPRAPRPTRSPPRTTGHAARPTARARATARPARSSAAGRRTTA